jgi:prepilin-type N-terminal cleavage/methylation domain-containing protein
MELQEREMRGGRESGFTLIELLIAIVVVGILTAVAIVGIAGLTDKGTKSACAATQDAIKTAQAVHFANFDTYPADFQDMTSTSPPELELSGGATLNAAGTVITGNGGWSLTVLAAGTATTPLTWTPAGC